MSRAKRSLKQKRLKPKQKNKTCCRYGEFENGAFSAPFLILAGKITAISKKHLAMCPLAFRAHQMHPIRFCCQTFLGRQARRIGG